MFSESSSSSSLSTTEQHNPRALFVQGLPQDDTTLGIIGRQMHDLVRKFIVVSSGQNKSSLTQYQLFFDRNVHRKVRDGCFLLLFDTWEIAQGVWKNLALRDSETQTDSEFIKIQIPKSFFEISETQENAEAVAAESQRETEFFTLNISWSAGKLRDHFFPLLPFSIRRKIFMDPTATFSLTDQLSANRTARLICNALLPNENRAKENGRTGSNGDNDSDDDDHKNYKKASGISICDAFACVGGNTFGFLQLKKECQVHVTSIELDQERCRMLQKNYDMMKNCKDFSESPPSNFFDDRNTLTIKNECALEFLSNMLSLPDLQSEKIFDVLFFDPPWGGPVGMKKNTSEQPQDVKTTNSPHGFPHFSVSQ